jgi:fibronectin-binding autotransporter adhesin
MRMQLFGLLRRSFKPGLMASALLASSAGLYAQNGTWTSTVDGQWGISGNWAGGTIANGSGSTANFNTLDISDQTNATTFPAVGIELEAPRTIGHMIFGDTNAATPGAWDIFTLTQATNILTLADATKPTITVNPLGPVGLIGTPPVPQEEARVLVDLAGTQGFTKLGNGILTIQSATTAGLTGGIDINAGTLRVNTAMPAQAFTIANGATLHPTVDMQALGGRVFNIASGATANFKVTNSVEVGRFSASGANINVNFPANAAAGARFSPSSNWTANGATSPATFVVNSQGAAPTALSTPSVGAEIPQTGAVVRLAPNTNNAESGARNFNGNNLATTAVTINNTMVYARTNSGGNTINMGSLTGNATSILSGGNQGSFVTYSVGALNTDTTFAGTIDMATSTGRESTGANTGGLNLTKVGTGKLTLSGTLNYPPTANTTVNRRGGITTISAGTLALTNSAAIAGGIVDGTAGNVLSTVNIAGGAVLDVSGYTAGTYSTANLQQVVGAGTVVGNYAHPTGGIIRPANTINGTTASGISSSVAVGGAINFANNFTWNGGEYTYDTTLNPATGNDLINVTGTATLTSGFVTPNFLAGVPTSGTYTLLQAGSISGSAASIAVNWPGRGADPIPFITGGNTLQFTVPAASVANLTWVGNNGSNWDVETTPNWSPVSTNTFFQSDNVTFNDSASSYTVNLVGSLQPSSVVVNNTANAYTFSGTGGIGGQATFTKSGSGLLTIGTTNNFTGPAAINGGTVDIAGNAGALGTGTLTLSNAQLVSTVAGAGLTNTGLVIANGSTNTITANGGTGSYGLPAWSGDGNVTINTTVEGKLVDLGSNTAFTGDVNIIGVPDTTPDPTTTLIDGFNTFIVRLNGAGGSLANSHVNLTVGASLRDRATSVQTMTLGALSGDATSTLYGYQGGSGATARTWVIGGLNTNTTFAGQIRNSEGSQSTTAAVTLTKVGTGELELTGMNTYTGNTNVDAGTLSISNPYLADGADVSVATGAILDLNFGSLATIDTIDSLFRNGISQPIGTYGRIGSGANFPVNWITGDGLLNVLTYEPPTFTPGDFDQDGDVDGRDFMVWQRNTSVGNLADWQANFGAPLTAAATAVPEPAGIVLVAMAGLLVAGRRRS